MAKYSERPGLGEGLMEAGVDVEVTKEDVLKTVVPALKGVLEHGAEFVEEHPRVLVIAALALVGAVAAVEPSIVRADNPPTPEEVKAAAEWMTGGSEPATELVRAAAAIGIKVGGGC